MQTAQRSVFRSCTCSERRGARWRRGFSAVVLLLCAGPVMAHDFWIDVARDGWAPEEGVHLFIGGGHYFPNSDTLLADRLVERFAVRMPGGSWIEPERREDGAQWRATAKLDAAGWYLAELSIRRPRAPSPDYVARSFFSLGDAGEAPSFPKTGTGLEIVPEYRSAGDRTEVRLRVTQDGTPVSARLVIQPAGGGVRRARVLEDQPYTLAVDRDQYLIVTSTGRETASLVLDFRHE